MAKTKAETQYKLSILTVGTGQTYFSYVIQLITKRKLAFTELEKCCIDSVYRDYPEVKFVSFEQI
jgi:hypothetical protein